MSLKGWQAVGQRHARRPVRVGRLIACGPIVKSSGCRRKNERDRAHALRKQERSMQTDLAIKEGDLLWLLEPASVPVASNQ
jgi:hypothetical protein